jgi:hypothetical protein
MFSASELRPLRSHPLRRWSEDCPGWLEEDARSVSRKLNSSREVSTSTFAASIDDPTSMLASDDLTSKPQIEINGIDVCSNGRDIFFVKH